MDNDARERLESQARFMVPIAFFLSISIPVFTVGCLAVQFVYVGMAKVKETLHTLWLFNFFYVCGGVCIYMIMRRFGCWPFENFHERGRKIVVNFNEKKLPMIFYYVLWATIVVSFGLGVFVGLRNLQ